MAPSHYFSTPDGPLRPRRLQVELAGQQVSVSTAGGIFSPDGVDKGTRVLLRAAEPPASTGNLLDIGCGWGPMALSMALLSPDATVWAVDVNERARALCAQNAAALGLPNVEVRAPEDMSAEVGFDTIWSNPPIRVGKAVLHQILRSWLPRLNPDGQAWLVVQKNLGADSLQKWLSAELGEEFSVDRAHTSKGFRLLHVARR